MAVSTWRNNNDRPKRTKPRVRRHRDRNTRQVKQAQPNNTRLVIPAPTQVIEQAPIRDTQTCELGQNSQIPDTFDNSRRPLNREQRTPGRDRRDKLSQPALPLAQILEIYPRSTKPSQWKATPRITKALADVQAECGPPPLYFDRNPIIDKLPPCHINLDWCIDYFAGWWNNYIPFEIDSSIPPVVGKMASGLTFILGGNKDTPYGAFSSWKGVLRFYAPELEVDCTANYAHRLRNPTFILPDRDLKFLRKDWVIHWRLHNKYVTLINKAAPDDPSNLETYNPKILSYYSGGTHLEPMTFNHAKMFLVQHLVAICKAGDLETWLGPEDCRKYLVWRKLPISRFSPTYSRLVYHERALSNVNALTSPTHPQKGEDNGKSTESDTDNGFQYHESAPSY